MVDRNLIATLSVEDEEAYSMVADALGESAAGGDLDHLIGDQIGDFKSGSILQGRIVGYAGDDYLVEVGLKS